MRLVVGDAHVLGAVAVLQVGMLGADARIVEARADRMRLDDLAVFVLQQIGALPCSTPGTPCVSDAECLPVAMPSPAASTPIRPRLSYGMYGIEDAHRVGAATDAGDHRVGLATGDLRASARCIRCRSPTGSRAPSSDTGADQQRCR